MTEYEEPQLMASLLGISVTEICLLS